MSVYKAINAVQKSLSKTGIGKDRKNEMQGYKFRGIDDVYNALAPLLADNGLCILPRCTTREVVERTNAKGTALFYVTVCAEFDFVASEDGSKHTIVTYGEAMDSGDKATNKAMSAAYKYACMQAFAIPTEGDNDADATTHEVRGQHDLMPGEKEKPAPFSKGAEATRTLVMKVRSKIQEHIANDRGLGVLEEWEASQGLGEEFCKGVWSGLTTPERDYVRKVNNEAEKRKKSGAEVHA